MPAPADPPARSRRAGVRWTIPYALFVLAAVVLLFMPLSLHPGSHLPDDGDALQGLTVLSWVAHRAPRAPLDVFDMNLYYPHPKGLAYSEHLIPQGLVVASLMALGASSITATNLLVGFTFVGIALAVVLWARELGATRTAAAVAGLVCALGTQALEEVSRVQMLWMQWIPLGLFFLHRFFRTGSTLAACGFAATFVLQALSGQYYLVSYPLYLLPIVAGYVMFFPERRTLKAALRLGTPLVLGALLLIPVEWQYLSLFAHYGFTRPLTEGTDLLRYVLPPADNLLYGRFFAGAVSATSSANPHFAGFAALGLAALGLVSLSDTERPYGRLCAVFALVGLGFLVLSAGADLVVGGRRLGPGPFRLLYDYVPFFDYTRAPERLSVYFTFGLALLAGLGASRLVRRFGARAAAVLLVLLPLEHARIRSYTRIPTRDEIPEVYHWLAERPGDFPVVELPVYPRRFLRFFGYESYFSTVHWKQIPFGKASFSPPALEYMRSTLSTFPSREATRLLQSLGVQLIVYHRDRDPDSASVIRRLHRDPHFSFVREFGDADPAAQRLRFGREVVFQVIAESPPAIPVHSDRPIPTEGWSFVTSSDVDPRLAADGLLETGWTSGQRQQKGQFFEVDLGGEYRVARISLAFASPYDEFPRALAANGFHPSRRWERLEFERDPWAPSRVVQKLVEDPKKAAMDLRLDEPVLLERVRLFIRETDLSDDLPEWRIPEIRIFDQP